MKAHKINNFNSIKKNCVWKLCFNPSIHFFNSHELSRKELAYGLDTIQLKASEKFPNCPFNNKMKAECQAAGQVFRYKSS